MTCAGSAIRQQINFLTHKFKINPIIVLESTNIETIASLSAKGIGSTIIPATVAMHLDEGEYNLCPLPQDILSLDYFLAYAKERNLSPNEKDMIETFKKINLLTNRRQPFPQSVINATTKAMDMNLVLTPFFGVKLSLTRKAG